MGCGVWCGIIRERCRRACEEADVLLQLRRTERESRRKRNNEGRIGHIFFRSSHYIEHEDVQMPIYRHHH